MNLNNQLNLPSYNEILLNSPAPNVPVEGYLNIKQSQMQINLLRVILNSVNDNINKKNISKILILIKDLFYIFFGFFVIILGIFATNIYNSIKSKSQFYLILILFKVNI